MIESIRRRLPSLALMGFGFWQAWWMMISRSDLVSRDYPFVDPIFGVTIATTLGYFVFSLRSRYVGSNLLDDHLFTIGAPVCCSTGTMLITLLHLLDPGSISFGVYTVSLVFISLGNGGLLCMWGELWAVLETSHVGRHLFASYLFAFVLFFTASFAPRPFRMLFAICLPIGCAGALKVARFVPVRQSMPVRFEMKRSRVVRIAISLFLVGFVHAVVQFACGRSWEGRGFVTLLGECSYPMASLMVDGLLLIALMLACFLLRFEYEARVLFRAVALALPMGIMTLACLPAGYSFIGNGMFLFGVHGLDMLIMMVSSDVAFRARIPIAMCFASSLFVERLGTTLGQAVCYLPLRPSLVVADFSVTSLIVLAAILVVCVTVLFTEYDFMQIAHVKTDNDGNSTIEAAYEPSCARLVASCGLTRRESQVLLLLSCGRSCPYIAAELSISENTVRNHVSNIYRKVGVYNRQDLLDAVASI